jgi:hypothetical protein
MIELVLDVYLGFLVYVAIRQTIVDRRRIQQWKREALPERIRLARFQSEPGALEQVFNSDGLEADLQKPIPHKRPLPRGLVQAMMPPGAQEQTPRRQRPTSRAPMYPPTPSVMQKILQEPEPTHFSQAQAPPPLSTLPLPASGQSTALTAKQQRRRFPASSAVPVTAQQGSTDKKLD